MLVRGKTMPSTFAIYVSGKKFGQDNLQVGLRSLTWGWRDSVLDTKDHRSVAERIAPGDLLVLGSQGPNPRVRTDWPAGTRLKRVLFLRATTGLYRGASELWPDEIDEQEVLYPNRVHFEVVYDAQVPEVVDLEPEVLRALKWSANTQGSAVAVRLTGDRAPQFSISVQTDPDGVIDHEGAFDAVAEVLIRREQRKLRKRKFGDHADLTCALCGKTFPTRLMRAAHVKRRSQCTPDELVDLSNIIPACTFGCDEMFEHGYVAVDAGGRVVMLRPSTGDLQAAARAVAGRTCTEHTRWSSGYFAWHHSYHQQA